MAFALRNYVDPFRKIIGNVALLMFFALPFFYIARDNYQKIMDFLMVLLFLASIHFYIKSGRLRQSKTFICAICFLAYLLIASLWAKNSRLDGDDTLKVIFYMTIFLTLFFNDFSINKKLFTLIMYAMVIAAGIYSIVNFYMEYKYPAIASHVNLYDELLLRRLVGYGPLNKNPIFAAAVMSMYLYIGVALLIGKSWVHENKYLIPLLVSMFLVVIFIYYTGSRSSYLAFFVSMFIVFARADLLRYVAVFLVASGIIIAVNVDDILSRGLSMRPELWTDSFQYAMKNPWLGHGYAEKITLATKSGTIFNNPHNMCLAIFYYGGVVGVSLFLSTYFIAAKSIFRSERNGLGIFARLIFVHGFIVMIFTPYGIAHRFGELYYYMFMPIGLSIYIEWSNKKIRQTS